MTREILIAVGVIVIIIAGTLVFLRRRKLARDRRTELRNIYPFYGGIHNGNPHSMQEWQDMANAGLQASRKRRGLDDGAA